MVAGPSPGTARRHTGSPVHVALGLRGLARLLAEPERGRVEGRGSAPSAPATATGSTTGSPTAARSTTRSASSASGSPCARTQPRAACASSATSRSTSRSDGADHRAHPELFQHDAVAGVPPDAFAPTGQLWGNPLYDWTAMRADGYRWWIERLRRTFELVDLTRDRPLPRLRLLLGGAGRRADGGSTAAGGAAPAPTCSGPSSASSARWPSSRRTSA